MEELIRESGLRLAFRRDDGTAVYETDIAIIGNGPSGMSMSAFLSGWRPFYNVRSPHPNATVHERLVAQKETSLLDQDVSWVENVNLPSRAVMHHPTSKLYDCAVRPDADLGHEHASCLRWTLDPTVAVPHVVIGAGQPGGSWNNYVDEVIPLSLANWLDLPATSLNDWLGGCVLLPRLPCGVIKQYFNDYPALVGIQQHMLNYTLVTSVQRASHISSSESGDVCWLIQCVATDGKAIDIESEHRFDILANRVVLASGISEPKTLNVPGEMGNPFIVHSLNSLRNVVRSKLSMRSRSKSGSPFPKKTSSVSGDGITEAVGTFRGKIQRRGSLDTGDDLSLPDKPILVVGDGLSAADVILYCLEEGLPVEHSFRRAPKEIKGTMLGRLSPTLYPEYHRVVRLMTGRSKKTLYTSIPRSQLVSFASGNDDSPPRKTLTATFELLDGIDGERDAIRDYAHCVVCVGHRANLRYFPEAQQTLDNGGVALQATDDYTIDGMPNVYVVGPLADDNFVRFLVGGCMALAKRLITPL